ncbi:MAG TPA: hypothetical protein VHQ41_02980 [Patescibacteria group bacterium]|jgi:hypothetical protein|nr:hypothetical protein [Patescibacteria group bacterium]
MIDKTLINKQKETSATHVLKIFVNSLVVAFTTDRATTTLSKNDYYVTKVPHPLRPGTGMEALKLTHYGYEYYVGLDFLHTVPSEAWSLTEINKKR